MNNDSLSSDTKYNSSSFFVTGIAQHITSEGFLCYKTCWVRTEQRGEKMDWMDSGEWKVLFWAKKLEADRILFSLKKRRKSCLFDNMGQSAGHYAKWNKPETVGQILYDTI